jgi:hypothetical protein
MLRFAVVLAAVGVCESVARMVKLAVPSVVGVPVIAPVGEFSISPAGRLPAETVQEYGVTPPDACRL